MPLRDHFRPPLGDIASWEELHGAWPASIAFRLNATLPPGYRSGVHVHLGTVDVAAFKHHRDADSASISNGATAIAWGPSAPVLLLETDESTPPENEVRVFDEQRARRLVAVVEIVSPRNKDRPESRDAFVTKCQALLQQQVCVAIVDPVTDRLASLYGELAVRLGAEPPEIASASTYAVACRGIAAHGRWRVEAWAHELVVGGTLPTLPLWLTESLYVPLELESTYEDTCRGLRIA